MFCCRLQNAIPGKPWQSLFSTLRNKSSSWQIAAISKMAAKNDGKELKLVDVKGDLFSCPETDSLVHCVSRDLHMGKGIAVLFKKKFGGVGELKDQGKDVGDVAVLKRNERFVYYLITKSRYYKKPTYASLRASLVAMKSHCQENQVSSLSMPMIGCGLDKLDWDKVSDLLKEVFKDSAMTISVYTLKKS